MRLSILLPTRNGGRLLSDCLRSMLAQEGDDFEVIVSDNANRDETADVLLGFANDPRLRTLRVTEPVTVTQNWNHALAASRGEYILMMGDDDLLLPTYLPWIRGVLEAYDSPDCITYNAYSYFFPSAIAGLSSSHYADPHFCFDSEFVPGRFLRPELKRDIVRDMFRFRIRIPLNMQTTVFARKVAERVEQGVFQPPFPDHYALNALLMKSGRWLYLPDRALVVGVSPKSFGHFVYSHEEDVGLSYLGITTNFQGRLPGNELLNAMHVWLERLQQDFSGELKGTVISRRDYVARQLWTWYLQWRFGPLPPSEVIARLRLLSTRDLIDVMRLIADPIIRRQLLQRLRVGQNSRRQHIWPRLQPLPNITSIAGFSEWLALENRAA